ncbi:MAG: hydrogenase [Sulfurospirillum sp.]|nr:hydrogenase [Sulfurospirillum sp.]
MEDFKPFFTNPFASPIDAIPLLSEDLFWDKVILAVNEEQFRVLSLFSASLKQTWQIWIVLGNDATGLIKVGRFRVVDNAYTSRTELLSCIHLFEREIYEQSGILPRNHPWLKPVRSPHQSACSQMDFYSIEGEDIHEVAVGPVHAGIIEPGHFRFQCYGEKVGHLEISLGYQHRGVEKALLGMPKANHLKQVEALCGDSTTAHSTCYAQNMEALTGIKISEKEALIRAILLELERIANHVGDIGALSGDVAFLTTASYCGKLRGNILNLTAQITGNRFGRGGICIGGTRYDIDYALAQTLKTQLKALQPKIMGAIELFFRSPSVLDRLEKTGIIPQEWVMAYGFTGLVAKASNCLRDVRTSYPYGSYIDRDLKTSLEKSGDVFARAKVRKEEILICFELVQTLLKELEMIAHVQIQKQQNTALPAEYFSFSMSEGWRGGVAHTIITDDKGDIQRYKVVDPSFFNWTALSLAMRDGQISDFPLCNKSFNLSYCGFDL